MALENVPRGNNEYTVRCTQKSKETKCFHVNEMVRMEVNSI